MKHWLHLGSMMAIAFSQGGCAPTRLQAVELRSNSLTRDLLAHWTFDDAGGIVAHDDSANPKPRDGVLTGGTWLSDGRFGGALHLAEHEFVSVDSFPPATSSFTVSAWVRFLVPPPPILGRWTTVVSTENLGGWEVNVDHNPTAGSAGAGGAGAGGAEAGGAGAGGAGAGGAGAGGAAEALALHFGFWKGPGQGDYEGRSCIGAPLDHWSQIAGVVDTVLSTFTVYRDGKPCFSAATTHRIMKGSATLNIGQWPLGGRFLIGDVDDIAIWGRALEPSEIALLTQTTIPSSL
jgi:Concanavalin A-like lectin/glucanases superfamily